MRVVSAQILVLVLFQFGLIFGLSRCASDDQQEEMQEAVQGEEGEQQDQQQAYSEEATQQDSEEWVQEEDAEAAEWGQESPSEEPAVDATLTEDSSESYVEADTGAQDAIAESLVQAIDSETDSTAAPVEPNFPSYETSAASSNYSNDQSYAGDSNADRQTYIVQKGDSLSLISKRIYGNFDRWRELASLNGIADANKIFPGDKIFYPTNDVTAQFSNAYNSLPRETVTVKAGDTLASIASSVYRDSGAWRVLWRQNEGRISNPNVITVGQQISYIPSAAFASLTGGSPRNTAARRAKPDPVSPSDAIMQPQNNIQEVIESDSGFEE